MTAALDLLTACAAWLRAHATSTDTAQVIRTLEAFATSGGGAGGAASFVWRPGEPNPGGNVYATWPALAAALAAVPGAKIVVVDPSLSTPAVVTPGTWPVPGVTFAGLPSQFGGVLVQLAPGAVLVDPWGLAHGLLLEGQSAGPAQITFSNLIPGSPNIFLVGAACAVFSTTANPVFRVAANRALILAGVNGGTIGFPGMPPGNGFPVAALDAPTAQVILGLDTYGVAAPDSVIGAGSLIVSYVDSATIPDTLAGFTGTLFMVPNPPVPAKLVFVNADNGSDTQGNGSSQRPFQSLAKAFTIPGERITFKLAPGTYPPFVIPTSPPRARLTIEGMGSDEQDTDGVTIENVAGPALSLTPAAIDAGAIRAVTLRNLKMIGSTEGLLVTNGGAAANSFLSEGLKLQNCRLTGPKAADLTRLGRFFAESCHFAGNLFVTQLGRSQVVDCTSSGFLEVTYDSTLAAPAGGRLPLSLQGSLFDSDLGLVGNPWVQVDPTSRVNDVLDGGSLIDVGGVGLQLEFRGTGNDLSLNLPEPSVGPPKISLDGSTLNDVSVSPLASVPGGPRFPVSANGVTWDIFAGNTGAGERVDLDLRFSSYNRSGAVTGGAGADQGTIDRSSDVESGSLLPFPGAASTFANPFPAGATYAVTTDYTTPGEAAITGKSPTGFTSYRSGAGPAEPCLFVITRYS